MTDTVRSLGEDAKDLIDQMVTLAEAEEGGGVDPTPPEPEPGPDPGAIPSGPDDPRFANCRERSRIDTNSGTFADFIINDDSGQPALGHQGFKASRFIIYAREGIRIGGPSIRCTDFYMEIAGQGEDHGDGIQGYTGGGSSPGIIFERGKLRMMTGANNCGVFLADNCRTSMQMIDMEVEDVGENCPNGALWYPNNGPNDTGIVEIGYRRCNFLGVTRGIAGIDLIGSGAVKPKILFWEGVRVNGQEIARPW